MRIEQQMADMVSAALRFASQPVTPMSTADFEKEIAAHLREVGRQVVEATFNQIEPDASTDLPPLIHWEATTYRPVGQKTPNRNVASLFGTLTLWRHGYRSRQSDDGEAVLFPLEMALGLRAGTTPALADRFGVLLAEAGATQQRVLQRLHADHAVVMGVKRLRALAAALSEDMSEHRQECQVQRLLALLQQAADSKGRYRPVLSVGRDGITLGEQPHGFFEVASTATLTVFDRASKRLGTVSLAFVPEYGQGTMTDQLTALLEETLRRWQGDVPRLCYVTDAGDNEVGYYRRVLRGMRHPRTGKKLEWSWIVDYFHASQRITTMAEALFGSGQRADTWAAKMRKLLKKPSGVRRVLLSAAALKARLGLRRHVQSAFRTAYNYLRQRSQHMHYADCRRVGLPIGSGITEAACKTIFTQRLKLSGMRWKRQGAQVILNLRVILLSGIWQQTYHAMLQSHTQAQPRTYGNFQPRPARKAT
jgi:hypothetical protein